MSNNIQPNTWLIVGSQENYDISKNLGFTVQGIKSRHRNKAQLIHPGDRMIYYLTGVQVLSAIVEVTTDFTEDHTPIWTCSSKSKRAGEVYPFRFGIQPRLVLEKPDYIPTVDIHEQIRYLQKWPEPYWRLGFQGNIHHWPEEDYQTILGIMQAKVPASKKVTV